MALSETIRALSAMQVATTVDGMRRLRSQAVGRSVGFVPTMGYPHEGPLSLVPRAPAEDGGVTDVLEGAHRPGHFRGVATVVLNLLNIVQPTRAYFGQKDAQQLVVIRKMVNDLKLNVEVVPCPTVRETGGLAMSSRNVFLSPDERRAALILFRALSLAERLWRSGERDANKLRGRLHLLMAREPLASVD